MIQPFFLKIAHIIARHYMNILAPCCLLKSVDFVTIKMLDKVSSLNANELRLSSARFADRSMTLRFHGNTIMKLKEKGCGRNHSATTINI